MQYIHSKVLPDDDSDTPDIVKLFFATFQRSI